MEENSSSLSLYLKELEKYPLLDKEETRRLIAIKDTDPKARETLINSNLRLVVYVVRYTNRKGMDFMDLVMAGNESLIHGIDLFKPDYNTELSTYVIPWIRQAVHRAIANQSRTIRIPLETSDLIDKLMVFISNYKRDYGFEPDDETCSKELNIPVKKIQKLKDWSNPTISIDTAVNKDESESASLGDMISDSETNSYQINDPRTDDITALLNHEALQAAMKDLSEREQIVLIRRFGLTGDEPWTLEQVAEELFVTKEYARQLQKKALLKLRKAME